MYRCNRKYDEGQGCNTPALTENEIKAAFLKAVNILLSDRKSLIKDIETRRDMLCDNSELEKEQKELHTDMVVLVDAVQAAVNENAREAQDQEACQRKYNELVGRYDKVKNRCDELGQQIADNLARREPWTFH